MLRPAALLLAAALAFPAAAGNAADPANAPRVAGAPAALPHDAETCTLMSDPGVTAHVGTSGCSGVRPGAGFSTPIGGCSLNFVFRDQAGQHYIGSAGHCFIGGGERTWAPGTGPTARQGSSVFGRAVYAALGDRGAIDGGDDDEIGYDGYDFALIRLEPGQVADPEMCHFGGPVAMYDDFELSPVPLHQFGRGLVFGSTIPARSGVATHTMGDLTVHTMLPAIWGDSGSGVVTASGEAIGVVVRLDTSGQGITALSRLDGHLARAEQALGLDLELVTADFHPTVEL